LVGSSIQWADAYRALDAPEIALPRNVRERDRLLLANAMADGEPPAGFTPGPRLHPPGTLARLQYETFDADGQRLDMWQVRALVPPLPALADNNGPETPLISRAGCQAECRAEIARGALLLLRSGDPGLAAEWVLRMPLARTFDLGPRPVVTHDVLDQTPRRVAIASRRREGRDVMEPANVRVTLLEACAGRVRLGTVTHLESYPDTTVPIPKGFRTYRWVQVDDCGQLAPLPRPAEPPPPPRLEPAPRTPVHAIVVRRAAGTGLASLQVDESWFLSHPEPVDFALHAMCRFEPDAGQWVSLPPPKTGWAWRIPPRQATEAGMPERVVVRLPADVALYWLQWIERDHRDRRVGAESVREALAPSGPVLCNDIDLGPAPPGRIPACVPFPDRAEARFVPIPREACRR
jgi:hypothetical protein